MLVRSTTDAISASCEELDRWREARDVAARGGADTSEFDRVRSAGQNPPTGYKQRNKVAVGMDGSARRTTTLSVNAARVDTARAGLAALQSLFPDTNWDLEEDADVARFLQRRQRNTWRSVIWVAALAALAALGVWLLT